MKKTIHINIGGVPFTIDEDAYQRLNEYLELLRQHFKNKAEAEEIISDIELRIAELLFQKVENGKKIISIVDIDEVIDILGKPEDYEETGEEKSEESKSTSSGPKRVYRDEDSAVIAGVCSGLGHYFGIDPVWIRLIFVIVFFTMGFGVIVYLICWFVIPTAKTTAEKLEMKGEAVNFENIGKKVEENVKDLEKKIKDLGKEASEFSKGNLKDTGNNFKNGIYKLASLIELIFRKVFGVAFFVVGLLLFSVMCVIALNEWQIMSFTNDGVQSFNGSELLGLIVDNAENRYWILISLTMLIIVPAISLLFSGIVLLFNIKKSTKYVNIILLCFFVFAITSTSYYAYQLSAEFRASETTTETHTLALKQDKVLELVNSSVERMDDDLHCISQLSTDGKINHFHPTLTIEKTRGNEVELLLIKSSKGKTSTDAKAKASHIEYLFSVKDSTQLLLPNKYSYPKEDLIRGQDINMVLRIPVGKIVYLDKNMEEIIYDIPNTTNTYDGNMIEKYWIMTEDGLSPYEKVTVDI